VLLIECKNIEKDYISSSVTTHVLKDINVGVRENDFLGILGPSGSGKTTLLYVLSGLEKPTAGVISLFEKPLDEYSDLELSNIHKNRIGFVFQFYNLIPNLTVWENMILPMVIAKKENDSRVDELLELVGMKEYKNQYPNQLSGGMQQRVAVARSLVNDPDMIFADEPTGNLDSVNGEEILTLLRKLHDEKNKTIVLVTHSESFLKYCTRYIRLMDGKIVQDEVISV